MYITIALAITTLAMAYLGYHFSIPQTASRRTRWLLRIAFIGLGALSIVLLGVQAHKTDKDQERAETAQKELRDKTDRLQRTIDQSEKQSAQQQAEIKSNTIELKELMSQPNPDRAKIAVLLEKQEKLLGEPSLRPPSPLKQRVTQLSKNLITFMADRERNRPQLPRFESEKDYKKTMEEWSRNDDEYRRETIRLYKRQFEFDVTKVVSELQAQGVTSKDLDSHGQFVNNDYAIQEIANNLAVATTKLP